MNDPLRFL